MSQTLNSFSISEIKTFTDFANSSDYSLLNYLIADPQSIDSGKDHKPREVFSGHYVPVTPTAIPSPKYISHSKKFFKEKV